MKAFRPGALALVFSFMLASCTPGPHYVKPGVDTPAAFKETPAPSAGPAADWKASQPQDEAHKGEWWRVFQDSDLDALEERIDISNQNLKIAEAQFRQARDTIRIDRAGLYPTISAQPSIQAEQLSKNAPVPSTTAGKTLGDFVLPFDLSYEIDAWGQIHLTVQAAAANAQASAADLESARLSLHAELAADYFMLRGLDSQRQLLDSTVGSYQKALDLTTNRYTGGLAAKVEVTQAETQLETTQAQEIEVGVERAQFEHAIAALVGEPASSFSIPQRPLNLAPPVIPAGIPSDLLQRRPDIAAAERRVAAANAGIGLAKTAYYPTLSLNALAGLEGSSITNWFSWPSHFFAIGPQLVETLYDAGRRHAMTDQAWAAYDANVAAYRQTVLTAFQEVEDNLAGLRILEDESKKQEQAVHSAEQSLALSNNRYKGGLVTYLEVTTAQTVALSNERTEVDLLTRRMNSTVLLIKALGGGWDVSQLPAGPTLQATKSAGKCYQFERWKPCASTDAPKSLKLLFSHPSPLWGRGVGVRGAIPVQPGALKLRLPRGSFFRPCFQSKTYTQSPATASRCSDGFPAAGCSRRGR
jgi:NodT family efflux transporter outer membrane factor (OMF) lipoprotein